jgi:chromate reductase, NAD(P)H dehydrogenase (quinone)
VADAQSQRGARQDVRILILSASLRRPSLNARLADLTSHCIAANDGTVTLKCMADFEMPPYDQDVQEQDGFPAGADRLRGVLEDNDAFVIVSPEYNASMPGSLKNAIDWLSRFQPQPFSERQSMLLSASPSMAGGNRGLWSLRVPLEHLGSRVYPDMFSLAQAHQAFDDEGNLVSRELHKRLDETIIAFMDLVEASKHYPCAKRVWVEYLGERPDPAIDRVEL